MYFLIIVGDSVCGRSCLVAFGGGVKLTYRLMPQAAKLAVGWIKWGGILGWKVETCSLSPGTGPGEAERDRADPALKNPQVSSSTKQYRLY